MTEKEVSPIGRDELRRQAEDRISESQGTAPPTPGTERLLHELQVHQVELEMQNAELRQAREDEAAALEKYTDLYDFAPVGYLTLDRTGTIRSANLTGSALIGIAHSRLIGRRFGIFVTEKTRPVFAAFLEKVFMIPATEACEVALPKEGNFELSVQIEGIAAASGEECRIALIDITERKRTEEALRQATKDAAEEQRRAKEACEATERAKSLFLANMSHELRTPMTGILGMLQLALEKELAPEPREYMETTLRSARSLHRILNDILEMARIETGKLTIVEKPFSPRECISEAVNIFTPDVRLKGLDFSVSVAKEVPHAAIGDQARLRQVLINLIANAVKFTTAGKVSLLVTAGGATCDGKSDFTFAVKDTGIGISKGHEDRLFQTFSQVDESHTRKYGGTGLGLAISRKIVELMGGRISFESKEGVGSTFYFTIPLREAGAECDAQIATESKSSAAIAPAQEGERRPHLLLVEDDPASRRVFELMLKRSNYDLDVAEDGVMAIEKWEKGKYDLVLMDIQLPQLNGYEATRAIREKEQKHGGHTPILAMTAHVGKEDKAKCLASGMDAYISKPLDFKECLQLIGEIIKQKPQGV